jgi:hypothetical protein
MNALTILQPFASLAAREFKRYETRSWATKYRGKLAIHAGKSDTYLREYSVLSVLPEGWTLESNPPFDALEMAIDLPFGAIIAFADLVGCHKIEAEDDRTPFYRYLPGAAEILRLQRDFPGQRDYRGERIRRFPDAERDEVLFGDWTPGRFAWELVNVEQLPEPLYCKGRQGLWNPFDELRAAYYKPNQTDKMKAFLRDYIKIGGHK